MIGKPGTLSGKKPFVKNMKARTVGPASKDVPESTIAAQPPSQTPEI